MFMGSSSWEKNECSHSIADLNVNRTVSQTHKYAMRSLRANGPVSRNYCPHSQWTLAFAFFHRKSKTKSPKGVRVFWRCWKCSPKVLHLPILNKVYSEIISQVIFLSHKTIEQLLKTSFRSASQFDGLVEGGKLKKKEKGNQLHP